MPDPNRVFEALHLVPATIYLAGFDPDHVWPVFGVTTEALNSEGEGARVQPIQLARKSFLSLSNILVCFHE